MKYYVGIDLGGTNIAAGVVDEQFKIIGKASVPTAMPRTPDQIADSMVEAARAAVSDAGIQWDQIESIGVDTPGSTNSETGVVEFAANLDFHNTPLKAMIEQRAHKTTYLENDANAAAYGEYIAGAAKEYADVVAITLGTGVGGGIILDGKILEGCSYAGGELGHMGMVYGGRQCTCGAKGCIEAYCSATALIQQTREAMEANKSSKLWEIAGSLEAVNGKTAFDAMKAGDAVGAQVVNQYLDYLGYAIVSLVNLMQPQLILLGGGICNQGETLMAPLRKYLNEHSFCKDPSRNTQLAVAQLGNDAGIIGAAYLFQLHQ